MILTSQKLITLITKSDSVQFCLEKDGDDFYLLNFGSIMPNTSNTESFEIYQNIAQSMFRKIRVQLSDHNIIDYYNNVIQWQVDLNLKR